MLRSAAIAFTPQRVCGNKSIKKSIPGGSGELKKLITMDVEMEILLPLLSIIRRFNRF